MSRRKDPPESALVPPPGLVARFDELDDELPPTPRWRAAGPVGESVGRGAIHVRRRSGTVSPLGTLTAGVLAVVIGVTALGLASRITSRMAVDGPGGAPALATPLAAPVTANPRAPATPAPSGPAASSAASMAPTTAPTPSASDVPRPALRFKNLKLVDRPGTIEEILADEFGWSCPVRVPPPTELTPVMLDKLLTGPGPARGLRKGLGIVAWVGSDAEPAASAFGASLVVRDGSGDLWLLISSDRGRVQRLEPVVAGDGTLAWWLADAVAAGTCPEPSANPGSAG